VIGTNRDLETIKRMLDREITKLNRSTPASTDTAGLPLGFSRLYGNDS
jgi:hypothetical protein